MNDTDMQLLQVLFDEPPPAAHVVAAGRARLREGYRHRAFRLPRLSLPMVAGLGTAALAAATAAVVAAVTVHPAAPPSPIAVKGGTATAQLTTGQVLLTAAHTVAARPAVAPQPRQWLRIVSVSSSQAGNPVSTDVEWMTFNGIQSAYHQAGKLVLHTDPMAAKSNATPLAAYDALSKLPSSPQSLLKALEGKAAGQSYPASSNPEVQAWDNIVQLLWNSPVAAPPKVQAEIFSALQQLPGLRVERVADALGNPVIGLYLPAAGHSDLLFDPLTYQVEGRLTISTGHYPKAEQVTAKAKGLKLAPAGTVTWSIVRNTTLVSGPGRD